MLTSEEREALENSCSGSGEYMCCFKARHRTGVKNLHGETVIEKGEIVGGAMLDAVEAIVARRVREAEVRAASEVEAIIRARADGDFAPLLPKLRAHIDALRASLVAGDGVGT